jgi:hypothetical protein
MGSKYYEKIAMMILQNWKTSRKRGFLSSKSIRLEMEEKQTFDVLQTPYIFADRIRLRLPEDFCVVHLQDKVTPSTKALWPGASFQNRSY